MKGKVLFSIECAWAEDFSNGLAKVWWRDDDMDGEYYFFGYVDKTGKMVWKTK